MFIFTKRWRLFWETVWLVVVALGIKTGFHYLNWEFLAITSLHTSILSGSIFVLGFILSSTHVDYKESERIPAELVTLLESLYQDGVQFKKQYRKFQLNKYRETILELLWLFKQDIHNSTKMALGSAKKLSEFFVEMEGLGIPANYIVKLKQEQNGVIRIIMRMHYLLRIQPLPSAFILVEIIVVMMMAMLLVTKMTVFRDELMVVGFFSFIYIYILKLINVMDIPFHPEGSTQDDVSLFLLEELEKRIKS